VHEESERIVLAGTALLELGNPADLEIVADVLSADAVRIQPGADMDVEEWGGDRTLRARVRRVEPSGFTKVSALGVEEQRVNVIGDFVDPPARLGDGFRVEVRIVVWEAPDVVRVPGSALFRRGDGWAVFVADGGRARIRDVDVGHRGAFEAEIRAGLEPGERVVLHPSDRVSDGARVRGSG
jgi:HlyD family secretion protein